MGQKERRKVVISPPKRHLGELHFSTGTVASFVVHPTAALKLTIAVTFTG